MIFAPDANLVICPDEHAYLDASGEIWVKDRAKAGFWPRSSAIQLSLSVEWPYGRRRVHIMYVLVCNCCGRTEGTSLVAGPPTQARCEQHVGRNPCAVEGCRRSREGNRPALDSWLCGRHWRMVPKPMKLVYSRIWRLEKKSGGWTDMLAQRHRRIWARMVEFARNRARGGQFFDIAAIEKEFGL